MIRRSSHLLARAVGALLGVATLALVVTGWLFASGPVPLTFLSPYVQEALGGSTPGYRWEFEQTILDLTQLRQALAISLTGVRLIDETGIVVAQVPRAVIGLSAGALLSGTLAPTSIEMEGPSVMVLRLQDGRFRLGDAAGLEAQAPAAAPNFSALFGPALAGLLEPAMIVGLAVVVGFIVLSIVLPILKASQI